MAEQTNIEWTTHSFNISWGCQEVSPACDHCYARDFAKRLGHGKRLPTIWGADAERKPSSESYWRKPIAWNDEAMRAGERHFVFCSSMADVFERPLERNEQATRTLNEARARLWPLIESTPHLDWQLLTKRPQNILELVPEAWREVFPPNVWVGCTVENQKYADARIPWLLEVPAIVRFLSCEPLLESIDLSGALRDADRKHHNGGIDWVIVGGESGGGARPFDLEWARRIQEQCVKACVAYFFKQAGSRPFDSTNERLRGHVYRLKNKKGGDLAELPSELRVRQFPYAGPA